LARVKGVVERRVVWLHALKNALIPVVTFAGIYFAVLVTTAIVVGRHALKNALIPVVTIIAVTMPRVVGGSTVVETVFAYPGMGRLLYTSIMGNDFVVAMTVVMIIAITVVFFNLLADILYGWLDPRIRYQG